MSPYMKFLIRLDESLIGRDVAQKNSRLQILDEVIIKYEKWRKRGKHRRKETRSR